ncbi:hypothetical protein CHS0354_032783 [Potamilus streckersoni]|uniref:Uncharacterized protein n=1 Tax=Potamilus streckersoni TaxID=2493646 RepID=A0AAE0S9D1_9BIVA|nr:hypothetical protein CHS0354_032783 [Potamilus streckersoni]
MALGWVDCISGYRSHLLDRVKRSQHGKIRIGRYLECAAPSVARNLGINERSSCPWDIVDTGKLFQEARLKECVVRHSHRCISLQHSSDDRIVFSSGRCEPVITHVFDLSITVGFTCVYGDYGIQKRSTNNTLDLIPERDHPASTTGSGSRLSLLNIIQRQILSGF